MKTYKNATRTEKWIRKAFTELMAEKKNLSRITVTEIVKKADITKPTFYYHYADLNELVKSIENEMIEEFSSTLEEAEKNESIPLEHYISIMMMFLKENEEEYKILANATDLHYFITKIKKLMSQKLDNPAFGFSTDSKTRAMQTVFISSACVDTTLEYFKGSINGELEDVEAMIVEAINKLRA